MLRRKTNMRRKNLINLTRFTDMTRISINQPINDWQTSEGRRTKFALVLKRLFRRFLVFFFFFLFLKRRDKLSVRRSNRRRSFLLIDMKQITHFFLRKSSQSLYIASHSRHALHFFFLLGGKGEEGGERTIDELDNIFDDIILSFSYSCFTCWTGKRCSNDRRLLIRS